MRVFRKVGSATKAAMFGALAAALGTGVLGAIVGSYAGIHITIAALDTTFPGTIPLATMGALFGGLVAYLDASKVPEITNAAPVEPPAEEVGGEEVEGAEEGREVRWLREEVARLGQELANAAREINCGGPVAHRIRVLKQEHTERVRQLRKALREKGDH